MDYTSLDRRRSGPVVHLALARPEHANGLDVAMARELAHAAAACDTDPTVRAVVLTGSGRFFCAGADLRALAAHDGPTGPYVKGLADDLHRAVSTFARMDAPLVVAVNGTAAGAGLSLAVTGDMVLAAASASFTTAYTRAGLSPDGSSTHYLPRLIGLRRTQELLFTNRRLGAEEAQEWGLVHRVVPDADLADEAEALAQQLAAGPLAAHGAVKRLLLGTVHTGLEEQMELEGRAIAACAMSAEGQEGVAAFAQKRAPVFTPR